MSLAGGDNARNVSAIALLALFLSFSTFSFVNLVTRPVACFPGDVGSAKCPQTTFSLGTWFNMPSATTELMGNTSYRGLLITRSSAGSSSVTATLSVGCISPSNTPGAVLQLQYANYSDTTHTNSSNFVNLGSTLPIDNSVNWPCPGNLETTNGGLPVINSNPVIFIFRVVGSGGGGTGDNPRFSSVGVALGQSIRKLPTPSIGTHSTTIFTYQIQVPFNLAAATTFTALWIATNSTSGTCGIIGGVLDTCVEAGSTSCTVALNTSNCPTTTVPFSPAFTGTVEVTMTMTGVQAVVQFALGTISLLSAQTLTV